MPRVICFIIILAVSSAASLHAKLPGQTLTNGDDPTLQKDVLSDMSTCEGVFAALSGCKNWRVVQTVISKPPKTLGSEKGTGLAWAQWDERWTVEHCGKKVVYTIHFDMRGSEGTIFKFDCPK
jgi:hypothetical protein